MRNTKRNKGFTLLEMAVALAIWMLLSGGVFFLWHHAAASTARIVERQNSFENARSTMDVLVMNVQLSNAIILDTRGGILRRMTTTARNPQGQLHNYVFVFNVNARPGTTWHQVLRFGGQEFSSGIERIYIAYLPGPAARITIEVHTACGEFALRTSVDARFKTVTANEPPPLSIHTTSP